MQTETALRCEALFRCNHWPADRTADGAQAVVVLELGVEITLALLPPQEHLDRASEHAFLRTYWLMGGERACRPRSAAN